MFQVLTQKGWVDVMHYTMLYSIQNVAPFVAIYFIVYHLAINLVGNVCRLHVSTCRSSASRDVLCVYVVDGEARWRLTVVRIDCAVAFRRRHFGQLGVGRRCEDDPAGLCCTVDGHGG